MILLETSRVFSLVKLGSYISSISGSFQIFKLGNCAKIVFDLQINQKETSAQMCSCGFAKFLRTSLLWSTSKVVQVYLHQVSFGQGPFTYCVRQKSKFLTLSHCEYATVHFGAYPPFLPVNAYAKLFIVHLCLLSLEVRLIKKNGVESYNNC